MPSYCTLSVVTANYNNAEFLDDFFGSIANSTVLPNELVFVDDGSTDNSIAIAEQWKSRVTFPLLIVALEQNVGFANALNLGVKSSTCDLILRVDPDDFIHPQRVEKEKTFLENNPSVNVIGSNTYYYNHFRKKVVGQSHFPRYYKSILRYFRTGHIAICNGSFTARRSIFIANPYDQKNFKFEEYEFFARLAKSGVRMENLSNCLTYYRVHKQNRNFSHFKFVYLGISTIQQAVFGTKSSSFRVYLKRLIAYLRWKDLKASNGFIQYLYFFLSTPFRLFYYLVLYLGNQKDLILKKYYLA